jgi:signal transduction histidine kinase
MNALDMNDESNESHITMPKVENSAPSRALWALVGCTLAAGFFLTAWAARASREREARRIESEFKIEAQTLANALEREASLFAGVLSSLGELHTLSDAVSEEAFAEFVGKGLLHQKAILGPFGFAQRIPAEVRAAIELAGAEAAPFRITEWTPTGLMPAGARDEYFPLTYQTPENGLGLPLGFDLGALPGQREAIERMRAGGGPALGASIQGPDPSAPPGFFVLAPIRAGSEFRGFTVARLWPQLLLERALEQTRLTGVQVTFYDPAFGAPPLAESALYIAEFPVALADHPWMLRCEAGDDYRASRGAGVARLIGIGGAAGTLLLALALGQVAGRARAIERTVRERTEELREANRQLAEEMDERARLEEAMHTAALREKQRIGQDLHDSLGQKLTGAVYLARALATAPEDERAETAEKLIDLLKDSVAQVRRTARGLAPLEVGEDALAPGLRRLAEETCDVFNIACSFEEIGAPPRLSMEAAAHVYHIAQEAVTNAVRHGKATDVRMMLSADALRIVDNGCGFDAAATAGGAGLRIMRHRAMRAGGTFDIRSAPGRTEVIVAWRTDEQGDGDPPKGSK